MLGKFLLTSIVAVGVAQAQRDPCRVTSTTIRSQADLGALSSCTTLSGSLIVAPNVADPVLTFNGIRTIRGDLIIANAVELQRIIAPELATIEGMFNMTSLTALQQLALGSLRTVGEIYWQTLPALATLELTAEVTQADKVTITDTILTSLQGINLASVARFNINNNRYLKEVKVQLANITDSLAIEFNSPAVVASFPNLTWANNATFRSCGEVLLPVLATVNGSLGFFENDFDTFKAPKLTDVGTGTDGGDITFANNDKLKNVSMPILETITGTLQFVNNSEITGITGYGNLTLVTGSIDISGEFAEASFPSIRDIRGGFNCQTTAEFDCQEFDKLRDNNVVKGDYVCSGAVVDPGTEGEDFETNGGGNGGGDDKNAAGRFTAGKSFAAIPALALFAVLFL